jgi:hypothetical protein
MFLCRPVFTSIKSDGFQLCCVILKQHIKNSGFIPATLYMYSVVLTRTRAGREGWMKYGVKELRREGMKEW